MCGPCIAWIMNGMVRNGPTPTMLMMLVEVACSRPMRRSRCGMSVKAEGRRQKAEGQPRSQVKGLDQAACSGARGDERVESKRVGQRLARAGPHRLDRRALEGLHPFHQVADLSGQRTDVQRLRTVRVNDRG